MTTEVVLLLGIFAFIVGGLFFGPKGPIQVFANSGPATCGPGRKPTCNRSRFPRARSR